jgi:hypothetical protein
MDAWWRAALLILASARMEAADFVAPPPVAIAGLHHWEVVAGELDTPRISAGYRFFVNPDRPALYSVMRYRVRTPAGSGPVPTERFLWVERPGEPVPLRCFELLPGSSASPATWREIEPGTAEYFVEMQTVRVVLAARQRERSSPTPGAR